MTDEIVSVAHYHGEATGDAGSSTVTQKVLDIDGEKYLSTSKTDFSTNRRTTADITVKKRLRRRISSNTISWEQCSKRDLIAFEAFVALSNKTQPKPVREEPNPEIADEVNELNKRLELAVKTAPSADIEGSVDKFYSENVIDIAYARVLASELESQGSKDDAEKIRSNAANVVDFFAKVAPHDYPDRDINDVFSGIKDAADKTIAVEKTFEKEKDSIPHNDKTEEIVKEVKKTARKIKKHIENFEEELSHNDSKSLIPKAAKIFDKRLESYYQVFYESSVVDTVADKKTNFAYTFGSLLASLQQFVDINKERKHRKHVHESELIPLEEEKPKEAEPEESTPEEKFERKHVKLPMIGEEEGEQNLSLGQSKTVSTSTDSLMPNVEREKPLGLNGIGSKSVSLFVLQKRRKSILLEPLRNSLERSPTCPHVTFNFAINGPIDQEDEEEEEREGSPILLGDEQGKDEEYDDDKVPEELFPTEIKIPHFDSWDPSRIQKIIDTPIRVPAVSLEKLKSHSAKRQKLGFTHTITMSSSTMFVNFMSLAIGEPQEIEESEVTEEKLEEVSKEIEKCRDEYFMTKSKTVEDNFLFFSRREDLLQHANSVISGLEEKGCSSDTLSKTKSDLSVLVSTYNGILESIEAKPWESPRDALSHIHTLINIIVGELGNAEEVFHNVDSKQMLCDEVRDWKRYFNEVQQHIEAIDDAYDNTLVIMNQKFFDEMRSQWASFGSTCDRVDTEMKQKTLMVSHKTLVSTLDFILNYVGESKEFISDVTDLPKMNATLEATRKKYGPVKVLRVRELAGLTGQVDSLLNDIVSEITTRSDISFCDCDRFSQELQTITNKIEPVIKKLYGKAQGDKLLQFHEFVTVSRHNLLTFLAHGATEGDQDFIPLLNANQTDFNALAEQFKNEEAEENNSESKKELYEKWNDQLTTIKESLDLIEEVSTVLPRNVNRYVQLSDYFTDIVKHVRIGENPKFNKYINVSENYSKMATNLQITIDYVTDMCTKLKKSKVDTTKVAQSSFLQGMQSSEIEQNLTLTVKTIDLSPYDKGFIDEPAESKADVTQAVAQSQEEDVFLKKLTNVVGQLVTAHIDALSRNYNLSTKSTQVLYKLVVTYCQSIIEVTPLIEEALETKTVDKVEENVKVSIKNLNAIQSSYNDKAVYSEFAQKRLVVFAQACKVLGHVTRLNIHHLCAESKFNDSPLQAEMRQLTAAVAYFPKFPSTPASVALRDLIRHSHQDYEEEEFELAGVLSSESKFLGKIQDLIQNFYGEADVRFFRLGEEDITSLKAAIDNLDASQIDTTNKQPTATVKRSLDVVSDNFHEYAQMLNEGNYNGEKLVKLTTTLSEVVKVFCQSALAVENGDSLFFTYVYDFQRNYKEFIEVLTNHSEIGSQCLFSLQARQLLTKVRLAIARTGRRLALMEQLDSPESFESSQQALEITLGILARFAKLLYIARDDLTAELEKNKIEGPRRVMAEAACRSYECTAQTLLTVKNKVTNMTLRIKAAELRNLVWSAQDILDSADLIIGDFRGIILDDIESIEFWISASMEPLIEALKNIAAAIPVSLPQSAIIRRKVSVIHAKCEISVQPFQECRSFTQMQ